MGDPLNIYLTSGTILSALGLGTEENLSCIRSYQSGIGEINDRNLFDTPFHAARLEEDGLRAAVSAAALEMYTPLERLFLLALRSTITRSGVDPADPDCGLLLCTTKGNIDCIRDGVGVTPDAFLYTIGERIASYFHAVHPPVMISNACVSGVTALIVASRLIEMGQYKHVLVAGADLLTRFVVSGFHSFKSVSPGCCRPYDERRDGLSLGEACGAVLVTSDPSRVKEEIPVLIRGGAITNDANHISGPSRTGDGLYYAIEEALEEAGIRPGALSFVNAHGTATLYNDEMESKAFHWAGLDDVPLNSMKPYWGHTLGASGLIETIACAEELRSGELFGTLGYECNGLPHPLSVSAYHRRVSMAHCLKTASGFGGCNAAIVLSLEKKEDLSLETKRQRENESLFSVRHRVRITEGVVYLDDERLVEATEEMDFAGFIRWAYKSLGLDDRKFYKMDDLCKLGYIAAAAIFAREGGRMDVDPRKVGSFLSNASSSLDTDVKYQRTIDTLGSQEGSPAIFVYTLPSLLQGELGIRYKMKGEHTFFVSDTYPENFIRRYAEEVMARRSLDACLIGWCELLGETYEARMEWWVRNN